MLAHALAFARRGWPVFPVAVNGKTPITASGFHAATLEERTVRDWWHITPDANIGVSTGPAALLVVDCDLTDDPPREPGVVDGADAYCVLSHQNGDGYPDTYTVRSASGGTHFYFRLTPGLEVPCSTSRVGWHVDVRSTGGYVVASPSKTDDGIYSVVNDADLRDAPDWLVERALPARPSALWPTTPTPARSRSPRGHRYVTAALAAETKKVATAVEGRRNDQLNRSAYAVARFIGQGLLDRDVAWQALAPAAVNNGLDPREVERTLRSAFTARG
jgi:hypothetical protein